MNETKALKRLVRRLRRSYFRASMRAPADDAALTPLYDAWAATKAGTPEGAVAHEAYRNACQDARASDRDADHVGALLQLAEQKLHFRRNPHLRRPWEEL